MSNSTNGRPSGTFTEIFPGVYRAGRELATRSLAPGLRVYGEQVVKGPGGAEYRFWNPFRSKLAGAINRGLTQLPIKPGSRVLYLGASTGTTPSHVSDIVGPEGLVLCVEFAKRSMLDLVQVCEHRPNMIPLLADARLPQAYSPAVEEEAGGTVDCIYEDVADSEQVRIMLSNARAYLAKGGWALLCVKARSIDATAQPQQIFKEVLPQLEAEFNVVQSMSLEPFDKDHLFVLMQKK